jgi:hypothetical protein
VFEHNWADGQNGIAILFTVRNQDGQAPWSVVQDVTFSRNVVRHAGGGIAVLGLDDVHPSQRTRRILVEDSVFDDVDGARWGGRGRLFQMVNGTADVVIEHVTGLQTGDVLGADMAAHTGFVFRNNIAADNGLGVVATGGSLANIATYFPGAVFTGNALVAGRSTDYPAGNFFPPSITDVGFVDAPGGHYALAPSSPYRGAGTDGQDLGADVDALDAATAGVIDGGGGVTPSADLVVIALGTPPTSAAPGGSFSIGATVSNQGGATAGSSVLRHYLSLDAQRDASDVRLTGSRAVASLGAGASSAGAVTLTIPSTTPLGTYRVLACADDLAAVAESNEANNCLASAGTVQIGRADLVVTSISSTASAAKPGGTLSVAATVSNLGAIASKATTTRYYLSLDSQKGPGDVVLSGTSAVPALPAGGAYTRTVTVTVPASTALGSYVPIACADDPSVVAEISEANNCTAGTARIAVSRADLVESALGNPPAGAKPGATFSVADTVSNQGAVAAESSRTRYYLSADQQRDAADRLLSATRAIPALSPGASSTGTVTLAIPSGTPAGSYYLLACADDMRAIVELDDGNNCRASATRVTVAP